MVCGATLTGVDPVSGISPFSVRVKSGKRMVLGENHRQTFPGVFGNGVTYSILFNPHM